MIGMRIRRVMMVRTMIMRVPVPVTVPMVAIMIVVAVMVLVMMMRWAMIMAAAAVRSVLMHSLPAARRCIHHRFEFRVGRRVQQVTVFSAQQGRGSVIEGRLKGSRLGMAVHRRPRQAMLATEILLAA